MKKVISFLCRNKLVVFGVRICLKGKEQFERLLSYSCYRYNFPNGGESIMHHSVEVKYPNEIQVGTSVVIGPNVTLGGKGGIKLGDYVRISKGVLIETAGLDLKSPLPYKHKAKPINISKGVWIGANSIILGGVSIGEYAIVGAGSVITKDIEKNAIVVGNGKKVGQVG